MKLIKILCYSALIWTMPVVTSCSSGQTTETHTSVKNNQARVRIVPRPGATIDDAIDALTVRLKKMGVSGPVVTVEGGTNDVVTFTLPNGCDTDLMMSTIGEVGHTVVYRALTAGEVGVGSVNPDRIAIDTVYSIDDKKSAIASVNMAGNAKPAWSLKRKIRPIENPDTVVDGYILYALQTNNVFDYAVKNATAKGVDGHVQVWVVYGSDGMRALPEYTQRNAGHHIAVVVDDRVVSVPYLNDKISEGRIGIKGDYTTSQYHQLSAWITPVKTQFSLLPVK